MGNQSSKSEVPVTKPKTKKIPKSSHAASKVRTKNGNVSAPAEEVVIPSNKHHKTVSALPLGITSHAFLKSPGREYDADDFDDDASNALGIVAHPFQQQNFNDYSYEEGDTTDFEEDEDDNDKENLMRANGGDLKNALLANNDNDLAQRRPSYNSQSTITSRKSNKRNNHQGQHPSSTRSSMSNATTLTNHSRASRVRHVYSIGGPANQRHGTLGQETKNSIRTSLESGNSSGLSTITTPMSMMSGMEDAPKQPQFNVDKEKKEVEDDHCEEDDKSVSGSYIPAAFSIHQPISNNSNHNFAFPPPSPSGSACSTSSSVSSSSKKRRNNRKKAHKASSSKAHMKKHARPALSHQNSASSLISREDLDSSILEDLENSILDSSCEDDESVDCEEVAPAKTLFSKDTREIANSKDVPFMQPLLSSRSDNYPGMGIRTRLGTDEILEPHSSKITSTKSAPSRNLTSQEEPRFSGLETTKGAKRRHSASVSSRNTWQNTNPIADTSDVKTKGMATSNEKSIDTETSKQAESKPFDGLMQSIEPRKKKGLFRSMKKKITIIIRGGSKKGKSKKQKQKNEKVKTSSPMVEEENHTFSGPPSPTKCNIMGKPSPDKKEYDSSLMSLAYNPSTQEDKNIDAPTLSNFGHGTFGKLSTILDVSYQSSVNQSTDEEEDEVDKGFDDKKTISMKASSSRLLPDLAEEYSEASVGGGDMDESNGTDDFDCLLSRNNSSAVDDQSYSNIQETTVDVQDTTMASFNDMNQLEEKSLLSNKRSSSDLNESMESSSQKSMNSQNSWSEGEFSEEENDNSTEEVENSHLPDESEFTEADDFAQYVGLNQTNSEESLMKSNLPDDSECTEADDFTNFADMNNSNGASNSSVVTEDVNDMKSTFESARKSQVKNVEDWNDNVSPSTAASSVAKEVKTQLPVVKLGDSRILNSSKYHQLNDEESVVSVQHNGSKTPSRTLTGLQLLMDNCNEDDDSPSMLLEKCDDKKSIQNDGVSVVHKFEFQEKVEGKEMVPSVDHVVQRDAMSEESVTSRTPNKTVKRKASPFPHSNEMVAPIDEVVTNLLPSRSHCEEETVRSILESEGKENVLEKVEAQESSNKECEVNQNNVGAAVNCEGEEHPFDVQKVEAMKESGDIRKNIGLMKLERRPKTYTPPCAAIQFYKKNVLPALKSNTEMTGSEEANTQVQNLLADDGSETVETNEGPGYKRPAISKDAQENATFLFSSNPVKVHQKHSSTKVDKEWMSLISTDPEKIKQIKERSIAEASSQEVLDTIRRFEEISRARNNDSQRIQETAHGSKHTSLALDNDRGTKALVQVNEKRSNCVEAQVLIDSNKEDLVLHTVPQEVKRSAEVVEPSMHIELEEQPEQVVTEDIESVHPSAEAEQEEKFTSEEDTNSFVGSCSGCGQEECDISPRKTSSPLNYSSPISGDKNADSEELGNKISKLPDHPSVLPSRPDDTHSSSSGTAETRDSLAEILDGISPDTLNKRNSATTPMKTLSPFVRFNKAMKKFERDSLPAANMKRGGRKTSPKKNASPHKNDFVLGRVTELNGRLRKNVPRFAKSQRRLTTGKDVIAPRRPKLTNPLFRRQELEYIANTYEEPKESPKQEMEENAEDECARSPDVQEQASPQLSTVINEAPESPYDESDELDIPSVSSPSQSETGSIETYSSGESESISSESCNDSDHGSDIYEKLIHKGPESPSQSISSSSNESVERDSEIDVMSQEHQASPSEFSEADSSIQSYSASIEYPGGKTKNAFADIIQDSSSVSVASSNCSSLMSSDDSSTSSSEEDAFADIVNMYSPRESTSSASNTVESDNNGKPGTKTRQSVRWSLHHDMISPEQNDTPVEEHRKPDNLSPSFDKLCNSPPPLSSSVRAAVNPRALYSKQGHQNLPLNDSRKSRDIHSPSGDSYSSPVSIPRTMRAKGTPLPSSILRSQELNDKENVSSSTMSSSAYNVSNSTMSSIGYSPTGDSLCSSSPQPPTQSNGNIQKTEDKAVPKSPSALCLSPLQRTPMQARKWRTLAAQAEAKKKSAKSKKLRSGLKKRTPLGKIL